MFSIIKDDFQRNDLEEFYKNNMDCLFNVAYFILHNQRDSEDAVQEAFCKIAHDPDKFFGVEPENRARYMIVVVKNTALDMIRGSKAAAAEYDDETAYGGSPSVDDIVIGEDLKEKLKQFIRLLPDLQRKALIFRCLMGFSVSETADRLGISQAAVRQRTHMARKAVFEFIQKEKEDNDR